MFGCEQLIRRKFTRSTGNRWSEIELFPAVICLIAYRLHPGRNYCMLCEGNGGKACTGNYCLY
jgi:hypothetical protein